jgi:hypothetical protein
MLWILWFAHVLVGAPASTPDQVRGRLSPEYALGAGMSLVRHHEHFKFERSEGVYFWMTDGTSHILCKVSIEALRDRSARDGSAASLPDTFVRHRTRIETIAKEKYAKGHRPNDIVLVLSKDLSPLPM